MDDKGNFNIWGATCGYPSILQVNDNTFYIVYSDFKTKDESGEIRKSIMFRKIEVIKRK